MILCQNGKPERPSRHAVVNGFSWFSVTCKWLNIFTSMQFENFISNLPMVDDTWIRNSANCGILPHHCARFSYPTRVLHLTNQSKDLARTAYSKSIPDSFIGESLEFIIAVLMAVLFIQQKGLILITTLHNQCTLVYFEVPIHIA